MSFLLFIEGAEEGEEEEKKEDETQYTVLGNTRPTSKTTYSMYSKYLALLLNSFKLYVAPPEPKTEEKYTSEDKLEHELVRRWRVVIQDIECINQTKDIINPFVKFIFGGDFYVDIKKMKSGNKYLPKGTKGISQFTDKINYLDVNA